MRTAASCRRPGPAVALALALSLGLAQSGAASALRPLQVEDILQQEAFGAVLLTPDGRFAVFEQRGPYASAARFDYLLYNNRFRTRLMVADLHRGGAARPLLQARGDIGYELGAVSPDGRRVAVYRVGPGLWELGVATLATGQVRWLGITPERSAPGQTVQWVSPTRLLVIARAPADLPLELRWMRPAAPLPGLHARTARGGLAVTVLGSGRELGARPPTRPSRLLEVSATGGAPRVLARGRFVDVQLAPKGRRIALLEAGPDIRLSASHPVQGPYGVATRRIRLVLVDRRTGAARRPMPDADVLAGLLSWSPDGDDLLVYARADGAPWTGGRLLRVGPNGAVDAAPGLRPVVERRPEVVYAGWMGDSPIVLAQADGADRADWYRLAPGGPVRLTGALAAVPHLGVVVGDRALLLAADGAAWSIDPSGSPRKQREGVAAVDLTDPTAAERARLAPRAGETLAVTAATPAGPTLFEISPQGPRRERLLAPETRPVALRGETLLAVAGPRGRTQSIEALDAARTRTLARINARFLAVGPSHAVPVRHTGPNGEALTSWILLPARRITPGRPPPLIAAVYPGYTYGADPSAQLLSQGPTQAEVLLAGHGYAVLVPSLPTRQPSDGPADRLAEQVLAIIDAAAAQPDLAAAFDPTRLGIWGHSFGGYGTLAIITQTDRFRAAVAEASQSNLISMHGTFSLGRALNPDEGANTPWTAGYTEDLQGDMRAPPFADPGRYVRNSAVLQAQHIHTPLMLVHGDLDNMSIGQAQEMFSALYRQDKDALLVTYWGEPHTYGSPGTVRDLYRRMFAWFDDHLLTPGPAPGAEPRPGSSPANAAPTLPGLRR